MSDSDHAQLTQALDGDAKALRSLVAQFTPVIQARVARALLRSPAARRGGRSVRQELEDMTQDVFVALFAEDAHALRAWAPDRGLSLKNFVGLLAERQVISVLRSGRRSPWPADLTDSSALDEVATPGRESDRIESRDLLQQLLDRLKESLSPRGLELFHRLYVREESVESVMESCAMSADAVYAWRSRLRRLAQQISHEMSEFDPSSPMTPQEDAP